MAHSKALEFYSAEELFAPGRPGVYEGEHLAEVAFPLGGIGTGCVSLAGNGGLVDWDIFNRPNKGSILPYAFTTLWAQAQGEPSVTRVLQTPPQPPYSGRGCGQYSGLGFGVRREDGSGLPHVAGTRFRGEFPMAYVDFDAPDLPVSVTLEAYSPFIPLNPDDSGLPIAVLRYVLHNEGVAPVRVSLAANMANVVGYKGTGRMDIRHGLSELGHNVNRYREDVGLRGLYMTTEKYPEDSPRYGSMALATTWPDVICQESWLRGSWYDMLHDFWDNFSADGTLPERHYGRSPDGTSDVGSIVLQTSIQPGRQVVLPVMISWHFPNFEKYWEVHGDGGCDCDCQPDRPVWRNYYASQWKDAYDVARYYTQEEERLYAETVRFHDTLFDSKLPPYVLDAISSQASILHSPTVLRLEDGTFYGFEGCHCDSGCCEGSCTHVWNYAQSVAFLFPSLERSLREADYTYNLREDGSMGFRLQLPLGASPWEYHPAADGQIGGLLKVYRDWLLCGDDDWLAEIWPKAKRALEYAWQQWDHNRDGVMEGIQHNTYDIEFYGPNTMMGSFYLGALRAGEEMARHVGDEEAADTYHTVYEQGRSWMDRELFNGEYYVQQTDDDRKYQYGRGCLSDHVIGQWWAHVVGLGYLFDREQVKSAVKAVFDHNWRTDFWEHANPQRIYALNDEQGLLLCSWPRGGRPRFPFVYSDEVWCGIEYQVASHLIYEGYVAEGLAIVKGLRDRFDGRRRNPWNEFECGSHYARSLASWSVLTALQGYGYDMRARALSFAPRLYADDWRSFWSVGTGWGSYTQKLEQGRGVVRLSVEYGRLPLERLALGSVEVHRPVRAWVAGEAVEASSSLEEGALVVHLPKGTEIAAGQALEVVVG